MVLLIYNADTDCYEGEQVAVSVEAFEARVQVLISTGVREGAARGIVLDEAVWRPDMAGVVELPRLCLHCRQPSRERRFCNVVCEAGFYAEVHS